MGRSINLKLSLIPSMLPGWIRDTKLRTSGTLWNVRILFVSTFDSASKYFSRRPEIDFQPEIDFRLRLPSRRLELGPVPCNKLPSFLPSEVLGSASGTVHVHVHILFIMTQLPLLMSNLKHT